MIFCGFLVVAVVVVDVSGRTFNNGGGELFACPFSAGVNGLTFGFGGNSSRTVPGIMTCSSVDKNFGLDIYAK